jgi:hypothetical protein
MKTCPRCNLINPDDATLCECGFDLVHGDARAVRGQLRRRGRAFVALGAVLIAAGLAGGLTWLPLSFTFFLQLGGYKIDLIVAGIGCVMLARGIRILDKPWTVKQK